MADIAPRGSRRRVALVVAAIAGGLVLVLAGVGLGVGLLGGAAPAAPSSTSPAPADPSQPPADPAASGGMVDPEVVELGWLPQPITTDPRAYGEAAALALATYDTTLATREDFVARFDAWHTINVFTPADFREESFQDNKARVARFMLPPPETWNEQALVKTIKTARVEGTSRLDGENLGFESSAETYRARGQHLVTTDIMVTTSAIDRSNGQRYQYDELFTISVAVQCGNSVPPPGSGQSPEDCMISFYFQEPIL